MYPLVEHVEGGDVGKSQVNITDVKDRALTSA